MQNFLSIHSVTKEHLKNLERYKSKPYQSNNASRRTNDIYDNKDPTLNTIKLGLLACEFNIAKYQFPALANAIQRTFKTNFGNKNITKDVCGEIWTALTLVLLEEFARTIKPGDALNGTMVRFQNI